MTRLKDITFESGSLTGTNGADSAVGTGISITSTSPLKGSWSALVNPSAATGYSQEDFTAVDNVYVSFYINVSTLPSANFSVCQIRDSVGAQNGAAIRLRTDSSLQLLDSAGSTVGSTFAISTNTTYRVGLVYRKGTGSNAVCEMYVVAGDDPFGAAKASTSTATGTWQSDRVRVGATSSVTTTLKSDNIRIDDTSMPTDDVVGGTTYNQSVNVTVGSSAAVIKQVNKPLSFTSVSVFSIAKQVTHAINITAPVSVTVFKQATKTISTTVGNVVPDIIKQVNKNVDAVVNSAVSIGKAISKTINITAAANVVISYGLQFYQTINVTVSNAVTMRKQVNKIIQVPVHVAMSMQRAITQFIQEVVGFGRNIGLLSMRSKDEGTQSLTGKDSQTISIDPDDKTTI